MWSNALRLTAFVASARALELNISSLTAGFIDADYVATYYSDSEPLLLGNDAGAASGGFHVWNIDAESPLESAVDQWTGRTKLLATLYNISGKDYFASIPATTSVLSLYELPSASKVEGVEAFALGDWSTICTWKSPSLNDYIYIFGKREAKQYLVRELDGSLEIVEIQTFPIPSELAGCAVSQTHSQLYLSPDDGKKLWYFDLVESTEPPKLGVLGEAGDSLTGVAVYATRYNISDVIFVALDDVVEVYEHPWNHVGTINLAGLEDIEAKSLSVYQAPTEKYPLGAIAYAIETDDWAGFGLSSLESVFETFNIQPNTEFDPRYCVGECRSKSSISEECSFHGFHSKDLETCDCFAGSTGDKCDGISCEDDCSGHGICAGPNLCKCDQGWGGLHCSFKVVEPSYETEANGVDGDDPSIWISPEAKELSRIVTTTKSEEGAGFAVFNLKGKLLQTLEAAQPNNVDIIVSFEAGNRTVDLVYAACRGDNTLCLFEITQDGELRNIAGGIQPSDVEDELYGSCVYRSKETGKQYLFVNEKSARYMQYELTATANGTLQTTLVREFTGGSGGQVEGCVADEDNGWLILGEEPSALWRYGAEPDASEEGYKIAFVGDGHLWGDVEGVTLIKGSSPEKGFILVSCQGVSAYNVYRRAEPHEYVLTFTIGDTSDGRIDHVTNTDGVHASSASLGSDFPHGLLVVHDDTNELPEGGADEQASYKLVGLDKILPPELLAELK